MRTYIIVTAFFFFSLLFSQEPIIINGIIQDSDGFPVADAEICLATTKKCVYSDFDGKFEIEANIGDELQIFTLEGGDFIYIINQSHLEITLSQPFLEEVVVVRGSKKSRKRKMRSIEATDMTPYAEYMSAAGTRDLEGFADGMTLSVERREEKDKTLRTGYSEIRDKNNIGAGVLTAGEVNDFGKWYYWSDIQDEELQNLKDNWKLFAQDRYCVILTQPNGNPVVNIPVQLKDSHGNVYWESKTDNSGKAELWGNPFLNQIRQNFLISYQNEKGEVIESKAIRIEQGVNFGTVDVCNTVKKIDISFMIDATGSMSDEMEYLQEELYDVIRTIKDTLPDATVRLSSVFYRDEGDAYITKKDDFNYSLIKSLQFLKSQNAAGGGDYPEAYVEALEESVRNLNWEEEAELKLLFVILDAPPHLSKSNVKKLQDLFYEASQKGIKIIPVASSGIDKLTEYLMRVSALLTNGTYTFLTDHSGIGNPHIEPTIDTYEVEKLNALLKRLILQYAYSNDCGDASTEGPSSFFYEKQIQKEGTETENSSFTYEIYPIPTRTTLNFKSNEKAEEVMLIDFMGKILWHKEDTDHFQLNIEKFPKGVYYIRVLYQDHAFIKKVIFY